MISFQQFDLAVDMQEVNTSPFKKYSTNIQRQLMLQTKCSKRL